VPNYWIYNALTHMHGNEAIRIWEQYNQVGHVLSVERSTQSKSIDLSWIELVIHAVLASQVPTASPSKSISGNGDTKLPKP
jgi:hypothetical protein